VVLDELEEFEGPQAVVTRAVTRRKRPGSRGRGLWRSLNMVRSVVSSSAPGLKSIGGYT
jgi:hypothetical protein